MNQIGFSPELFARLQGHAIPLVDTIESVIGRALDALEAGNEDGVAPSGTDARSFNPAAAPNLTHTTLLSAVLNGQTFSKGEIYWNTLMHAAISAAAKSGLTAEQVKALLIVPSTLGDKTGQGFKPVAEAGVSIQGQDANGAWKQTHHLATKLGFSVEVTWRWDGNEKAAMPNMKGSFSVGAVE